MGVEQAKNSNKIYQKLLDAGIIEEQTPVFSTSLTRANQTAQAFSGKPQSEIEIDDRFIEREFGTIGGVIPFKLQKELGDEGEKILSGGTSETKAEHGVRVEAALQEQTQKIGGKFVVVSHSGTSRRIIESMEGDGSIFIPNAQPYIANSKDGGKTWDIKHISLNEKQELQFTELTEMKKSEEETKAATLLDLIKNCGGEISLLNNRTNDDSKLKIILNGVHIGSDVKQKIADELGEFLVGNDHKAIWTRGVPAKLSVNLSPAQAEIFTRYAELKDVIISTSESRSR